MSKLLAIREPLARFSDVRAGHAFTTYKHIWAGGEAETLSLVLMVCEIRVGLGPCLPRFKPGVTNLLQSESCFMVYKSYEEQLACYNPLNYFFFRNWP